MNELPPLRSKPLMLVILEWFNSGHSIYRTHSSTLRAARDQFRLMVLRLQRQQMILPEKYLMISLRLAERGRSKRLWRWHNSYARMSFIFPVWGCSR